MVKLSQSNLGTILEVKQNWLHFLTQMIFQMATRIFPRSRFERAAFLLVVLTVAFCEELIYRGFVQQLFTAWCGGLALAGIAVSAALFSFAHLYQGRRGLASTFAAGLLFAGVRWWCGSLLPAVVAHFVADLTIGFLAPKQLALDGKMI